MAKREENLKKINDELEKLSDEELDKVAGGNHWETSDDSRFLNSLGGFTDRYSTYRVSFGDHDKEIRDGWAKVGILAEIHSGNAIYYGANNVYKMLNGKVITRKEAMEHAMKYVGKQMEESDWDW